MTEPEWPGGSAAPPPGGGAMPPRAPAAPGPRPGMPDGPPWPGAPGAPPLPPHVRNPVWYALVTRAQQAAVDVEDFCLPAWRRRTRGEKRWPVSVSVVVTIVLQLLLPDQLSLRPLPAFLLPVLEGALLVGLAIANPVRIERRSVFVRWTSLILILMVTAANAGSAVLLIREILTRAAGSSAGPLLASGAAIWVTNVIAFGLWYWEFDRGGPVHRAHGTFQYPDFLFPQMTVDELTPPDWEPRYIDYLYLSFTNATAFSPTDVMPMARWAKLTMAVQSAVSLGLGALVIARAVNILP